jgi:hypothetical protein
MGSCRIRCGSPSYAVVRRRLVVGGKSGPWNQWGRSTANYKRHPRHGTGTGSLVTRGKTDCISGYSGGGVTTQVSLETRDSQGIQPATVVLKDRFLGQALCWAPDGRIIYSQVRREAPNLEDSGLWAIAIKEATGEARGPAQPLSDARKTGGVGWISDLSISRDSKHLALVRHSVEPQVFVGELESKRPPVEMGCGISSSRVCISLRRSCL